MGTGAVSRYKLSRSQNLVKVQYLNCVQMSVSGCNGHYEFVLGAETKAKSVTNNLPLLSVLGVRAYFYLNKGSSRQSFIRIVPSSINEILNFSHKFTYNI